MELPEVGDILDLQAGVMFKDMELLKNSDGYYRIESPTTGGHSSWHPTLDGLISMHEDYNIKVCHNGVWRLLDPEKNKMRVIRD
jgi:hypothetical protein